MDFICHSLLCSFVFKIRWGKAGKTPFRNIEIQGELGESGLDGFIYHFVTSSWEFCLSKKNMR